MGTDSAPVPGSLQSLHSAYRIKRRIQIFQKALQIYNKIENGLQRLKDIADLLSVVSSGDLVKIISVFESYGINKSLSNLAALTASGDAEGERLFEGGARYSLTPT